ELAEKSGISAAKIIGELMKNGILANINQKLDFETASIIAGDLHIKIVRKREKALIADLLEKNLQKLLQEDDPALLVTRPPIVTVMGHVDHGKTKLLDVIRQTNVIDTESGGITQHIGAYQVEKKGKLITFLDTPGHEAFTAMRARGAQATDIAILVVAADEGVKPQTMEALNHAKEAKIPIIVAITKMDKPEAKPDMVKARLAELGLQPEDWSGNTIMVPVSAFNGTGIEELLENILLVADVANLKANPARPAVATIIESHLNTNLGPQATVLINTGTLRIMDNFVIGEIHGRIKTMQDYTGKRIRKAPPGTPVRISGLSGVPQVGDILQVASDEKTAKKQAELILTQREEGLALRRGLGVDEIMSKIKSGEIRTLKIILKGDTEGSLEAIKQELSKIHDEKVAIQIIHCGVGHITESDVLMASASSGLVIGFHVEAGANVKKLAEREHVEVITYEIIYKLSDDLKKLLSGLLEPEIVETILGRADVRQIFLREKKEMIVGCKITNGKMEDKAQLRIFRNDVLIGEGVIVSLQKAKDKVKEVKEGNECGIRVRSEIIFEVADVLEAYKKEKRIRTLS
ncbi:translation initiation factor IF-2, partial [Candidatus Peregrinibacteria bacterium]|nr:translation initiation factor IF-2 [Candidatus Peregrinibacteria bacterium]